jgi:flagella synthesis protein FlgN
MPAKAQWRQLLQDIHSDLDDYRQLQLALEQQFSAALAHDAAALSCYADRISQLVAQLQQRRLRREQLARQLLAGNVGRKPSLMALFALLPEPARQRCQQQWQALQALAADCKQLNERNGQLLLNQHECYQRVLFGESDTYAAP